MPIYEYQCSDCDHRLEVIQKISEAPLVECPECGQPSLKRLVSAAAFRLKGTGWYETDFKHKGRAPAKSAPEKTGETKSEDKKGKTDSKDSKAKSAGQGEKKASAAGGD
jgi:putative FmdB family regulatory protein